MRKNITILGAGGPAGIGLTRCLKEHYELRGSDKSTWGELMMEVEADHGLTTDCDLLVPVPDSLVFLYSGTQNVFLPAREEIAICQDKAKTAQRLGDLAPKTFWVRDTKGAGGAGSQMSSEYLPGRNYSCELVYHRGVLLAHFVKERISYLVRTKEENVTASGSSAVSICRNLPELVSRGDEAVRKIAQEPHGFFGIDFKEDSEGVPKITEINAGRLLTASYTFFWMTGYNLPLVGVRAALGEDPAILPDYPEGWGIVRQVDQKPRLFGPEVTKTWR